MALAKSLFGSAVGKCASALRRMRREPGGAEVPGAAGLLPNTQALDLDELLRLGIAEAQLATVARKVRERHEHLLVARHYLTAALRRCGQSDPNMAAHLLAVLLKLGEDARTVQGILTECSSEATAPCVTPQPSVTETAARLQSTAEEGNDACSEHSSEHGGEQSKLWDYDELKEGLLHTEEEESSPEASPAPHHDIVAEEAVDACKSRVSLAPVEEGDDAEAMETESSAAAEPQQPQDAEASKAEVAKDFGRALLGRLGINRSSTQEKEAAQHGGVGAGWDNLEELARPHTPPAETRGGLLGRIKSAVHLTASHDNREDHALDSREIVAEIRSCPQSPICPRAMATSPTSPHCEAGPPFLPEGYSQDTREALKESIARFKAYVQPQQVQTKRRSKGEEDGFVEKSRQLPTTCSCGAVFTDDSVFCRMCGKKRSELEDESADSLRLQGDVSRARMPAVSPALQVASPCVDSAVNNPLSRMEIFGPTQSLNTAGGLTPRCCAASVYSCDDFSIAASCAPSIPQSAAPSGAPSPFVGHLTRGEMTPKTPNLAPADAVKVRVLNGVSGEEEISFPVSGFSGEQSFLTLLDKQCQSRTGQPLSNLNWLSQAQPGSRFQRRRCDAAMVKDVFSRNSGVLLLCTVPQRPPSELSAAKVRLKNLAPAQVALQQKTEKMKVVLDTSPLEAGHAYSVAFTHQWSNMTHTAEAVLLSSGKGVSCILPWQMLAASTAEGLYDVHLVIDAALRSENRRTLTVGSAESELSSSSVSQSCSAFVPIGKLGR